MDCVSKGWRRSVIAEKDRKESGVGNDFDSGGAREDS